MLTYAWYIAQKMKFSIKEFFSKCDQIRSFRSFIFCAVILQVIIFCCYHEHS